MKMQKRKVTLTVVLAATSTFATAQTAFDDQDMQALTQSVLAGLQAPSGVADPRKDLTSLVTQALQQGQSDAFLEAIIAEATKPTPDTTQTGLPEIPSSTRHRVKRGESLGKIAETYYGDPEAYLRIFNANRGEVFNPDLLRIGQILVIPPA